MKLNEKIAQPELPDFKTGRNKLAGMVLNQGKQRNQAADFAFYAFGNSKPLQSPKHMNETKQKNLRGEHSSLLKSIPALYSYLCRFN